MFKNCTGTQTAQFNGSVLGTNVTTRCVASSIKDRLDGDLLPLVCAGKIICSNANMDTKYTLRAKGVHSSWSHATLDSVLMVSAAGNVEPSFVDHAVARGANIKHANVAQRSVRTGLQNPKYCEDDVVEELP